MNVRVKFNCISVKKYASSTWDKAGLMMTPGFLYSYELQAATGDGSDENKSFFGSAPSGNLQMSAVRDGLFEPGKSYYLDFTSVDA